MEIHCRQPFVSKTAHDDEMLYYFLTHWIRKVMLDDDRKKGVGGEASAGKLNTFRGRSRVINEKQGGNNGNDSRALYLFPGRTNEPTRHHKARAENPGRN